VGAGTPDADLVGVVGLGQAGESVSGRGMGLGGAGNLAS
jgi:hypothetical protein